MPRDYETAFSMIWEKIGNAFRDHEYLLYSKKLSDQDKTTYSKFSQECPTWKRYFLLWMLGVIITL